MGSPVEEALRRTWPPPRKEKHGRCFMEAPPTINYNQRPCQHSNKLPVASLRCCCGGGAGRRLYAFVARSLLSALSRADGISRRSLSFFLLLSFSLSLFARNVVYPVQKACTRCYTVITRKDEGDVCKAEFTWFTFDRPGESFRNGSTVN